MAQSDEKLIQQMKSGDENAMEELVSRWYPRIYAYAYRMTGQEQDAQDITQETFLAVIRYVGNFKAGCSRSLTTNVLIFFDCAAR